ncbi:hypothetical protein BC937DRAFT_94980 [Endogone sp. FLAS-F59071]|nr:hypothetical protein BC937DRAFT_94980 [Endogone sp. FLAS-F59071]|eukprot:RUS20545.1 hypothetical protein BC937DRAFT_94980 [Endogone sp. FLAS-F59071]
MTDLLTSPGRQSSRLFAPSYPSPLRNATRFAASGTSDRTNDGGPAARPSEDEELNVDKTLNRLKKELKIWERSFMKENGKEPTTEDISILPEMADDTTSYTNLGTTFALQPLKPLNPDSTVFDPSPSLARAPCTPSKSVDTKSSHKHLLLYPRISPQSHRSPSLARCRIDLPTDDKIRRVLFDAALRSPTRSNGSVFSPTSAYSTPRQHRRASPNLAEGVGVSPGTPTKRTVAEDDDDDEMIGPSPVKMAKRLFAGGVTAQRDNDDRAWLSPGNRNKAEKTATRENNDATLDVGEDLLVKETVSIVKEITADLVPVLLPAASISAPGSSVIRTQTRSSSASSPAAGGLYGRKARPDLFPKSKVSQDTIRSLSELSLAPSEDEDEVDSSPGAVLGVDAPLSRSYLPLVIDNSEPDALGFTTSTLRPSLGDLFLAPGSPTRLDIRGVDGGGAGTTGFPRTPPPPGMYARAGSFGRSVSARGKSLLERLANGTGIGSGESKSEEKEEVMDGDEGEPVVKRRKVSQEEDEEDVFAGLYCEEKVVEPKAVDEAIWEPVEPKPATQWKKKPIQKRQTRRHIIPYVEMSKSKHKNARPATSVTTNLAAPPRKRTGLEEEGNEDDAMRDNGSAAGTPRMNGSSKDQAGLGDEEEEDRGRVRRRGDDEDGSGEEGEIGSKKEKGRTKKTKDKDGKEQKKAVAKERATDKGKKAKARAPMLNVETRYPLQIADSCFIHRVVSNSAGNQVSDNFVALRLPTKGFKKDARFGRGRGGWRSRTSRTSHTFASSARSGTSAPLTDDVFGYDSGLASWLVEGEIEAVVGDALEEEVVRGRNQETFVVAKNMEKEEREGMEESICCVSRKYLKDMSVAQAESNSMDVDSDDDQEPVMVNVSKALKSVWGFESFREGQLPAIRRVLLGRSTLLVIPTGAGKSLCYQLPALILSRVAAPSLTLVISPTISLMQDQIRWLPAGLSGCCWTSGMTTADFRRTLSRLSSNEHKVLFISPEKLASRAFLDLCRSKRLPPIKFACIDEVHCVSEWSHNFRPAYLLLNTILRDQLRVPCILGITGTATAAARRSICAMLGIDPQEGVIAGGVVRENIVMSVSMEKDREAALVRLLRSPTYSGLDSIIIYVMKQNQADTLASYLRVRNFNADSYHAGKGAQERHTVQTNFMRGHLRILVATIAFGLGLNKADVRSVIHFSMPKSLENYVQEIGRSGRDGLPAYCHHFLSHEDYLKLRSLAHGDSVDEVPVRRLLLRVVKPQSDNDVNEEGQGKFDKVKKPRRSDGGLRTRMVAVDIERTEWDLDMRREVVATLLSYLELDERQLVKLLPPIFTTCNIRFTNTDAETLADKHPLVEAVLKHARKIRSTFACNSIELCESLQMTFPELHQSLNQLKRQREIHYEFIQPAFCVEIPDDLSEVFVEEEDEETYFRDLQQRIMDKVKALERARIEKVDQVCKRFSGNSPETNRSGQSVLRNAVWAPWMMIFNLFRRVAANTSDDCLNLTNEITHDRFETMKRGIEEYFDREVPDVVTCDRNLIKTGIMDTAVMEAQKKWKSSLEIDVKVFVNQNADVITAGRTVARIFHGLSSPRFPALDWYAKNLYKNQYWGKYADYDFDEIVRSAQVAIVQKRTRYSATTQLL